VRKLLCLVLAWGLMAAPAPARDEELAKGIRQVDEEGDYDAARP